MLSKLLREETIRLDIECADWEDAVRQSAVPLLAAGDITEEYVQAIIDNVKANGPYIVLTKGLALPHATNKVGVNRTAMSFLRLKTPVNFGNVDNDPVRYCFMLAPKDTDAHMGALVDFVTCIGDEAFKALMEKSTDPKEIYQYIIDHENNNFDTI